MTKDGKLESEETELIPMLIVDDDETFATILSRSLSKRGFKTETAFNISEALRKAQLTPPKQAIVDLKIAAESGLELIPQLKLINPEMAILVLTGYSSIATAVEAIKLGAINYLCKPADSDEILAAFNKANEGDTSVSLSSSPPSVDRLEWEHIQKVLSENEGNISATARSLGMHRRTLQRKLQKRPVKK